MTPWLLAQATAADLIAGWHARVAQATGGTRRAGAGPGGVPAGIAVCARSEARSPYRLAPAADGFDPAGPAESVARERHRLLDVGGAGAYANACSAAGAAGATGGHGATPLGTGRAIRLSSPIGY